MKKIITAFGIVILVFGILLAAFTFIALPKNKTEAYQIPESTIIVDQIGLLGPFPTTAPTTDFAVGGFNFSAGELLNIQVNVTSGQKIDFYVSDGSKGLTDDVGSSSYLSYPNITMVNTVVPKNSSYNFVFSSSSAFFSNDVHWQIEKLWNETDCRSVTQNVPLLPFQILYVGVGIALSGFAITVYGTSLKKIVSSLTFSHAKRCKNLKLHSWK